jgi:hypothetical protein
MPSNNQPGSPPPWPGYEPTSHHLQQDRVLAKYGVLAVVAVLLLVAMGVGVAAWATSVARRTTVTSVWTTEPTSASTRTGTSTQNSTVKPSTLGNCSGSAAETTGWRAVIPAGWTCEYEAGVEVFIVDELYDTIMVSATQDDPATACSTGLAQQAKVTPLPDTIWGGKNATTAGTTLRDFQGQARCAHASGFTFVMFGVVGTGTMDQLVAAEDSLAHAWRWKF